MRALLHVHAGAVPDVHRRRRARRCVMPANYGLPLLDYPTAWEIQHEVGPSLVHHNRCSSVPGWSPMSGPGLLCDCGAVRLEWERRVAARRGA